jgi:hypothetical protein
MRLARQTALATLVLALLAALLDAEAQPALEQFRFDPPQRLGSYPDTVSAAARSVEGRFPAAVRCHAPTRTAVQMRVASAGPLWWATRRL